MKKKLFFGVAVSMMMFVFSGCGEKDKIPPVIQANDIEVWYGNSVNIEDIIECTDDSGEKPTIEIKSGTPDFEQVGTQKITIEAKDSAGNSSSVDINLTVKDFSNVENCYDFSNEVISELIDCNVSCEEDRYGGVQIDPGTFSSVSTDGEKVRLVSFLSLSPLPIDNNPVPINDVLVFHLYMEHYTVDTWYQVALDNCKINISGAGESITDEYLLSFTLRYGETDSINKLKKMIEAEDMTITITGSKEEINFDTYQKENVNHKYVYKCSSDDIKKLRDIFMVSDDMLGNRDVN